MNEAVPVVILLHGYMDAAGTWDLVAPGLAARGFRVLAPDMRGFGDGVRAPRGSYYHFTDYVADLAGLVAALSPGRGVSLVGHSMGGMVATLYAGAFPERVARLANLEGLGPPDNPFTVGPDRVRAWIDGVQKLAGRPDRSTMSLEDAQRRLVTNHPTVAADILATRLPHLVRPEGPGYVWRADPLHRTRSPVPFFAELSAEFAKRVTCPTLFVSGGPTGYHPPDEEARLAAFANLERASLSDGGHMLHWTKASQVVDLLLDFLENEKIPADRGD
jgi:pimeloyl-ACP methyl ester carboxylesterase